MPDYTKRPNIPGLMHLPPNIRTVLIPMKQLLDIHEGRAGNPAKDRFVKIGEMSRFMSGVESRLTPHTRPYNEDAPDPPTNVEVLAGAWGNRISWTNATDEDLWAVEVFAATSNDWTQSQLVATVTIPPDARGKRSEYVHFPDNILLDHYYWVRSVDYSGNASRLAPPDENAGILAPGHRTVGQTIDRILAALGTVNAPLWDPNFDGYQSGDIVEHNNRQWQCFNSPVPEGVEPDSEAGATYWRRTGILVQGEVDGKPTVGINGALVVDQTLLARAIKTDELQVGTNVTVKDSSILVGHIGFAMAPADADKTSANIAYDTQRVYGVNASTVYSNSLAGANHAGTDHAPSDADKTQQALDWGAAIDHAKVNNFTLIENGFINTAVLLVTAANIGTAAIQSAHLGTAQVKRLHIGDREVTLPVSVVQTVPVSLAVGAAYSRIASMWLNAKGEDALFHASIQLDASYIGSCRIKLTRNGVIVQEEIGTALWKVTGSKILVSLTLMDANTSNFNAFYELWVKRTDTVDGWKTVEWRMLYATVFFR